METAIWLAEVATRTQAGRRFLEHLRGVNADANADLPRLALKLATGAGKTTVMAMLIAWQARHGGALLRLSVERAGAVGGLTGWRAAMPVVQWSVTK